MNLLYEMLEFNRNFVEEKGYEPYQTSKYPDKRAVILTCMDTRLLELLPAALNIQNGDVKIIKNAGAIISHPFGSIMRSILVAVYELQAEEVFVIGHHDCGMSQIQSNHVIEKMKDRGIKEEIISTLMNSGINIKSWLKGFASAEENVRNSVNIIKNHPLMAENIPVHGLIINPETGKLDLIIDGYKNI